MTILPYIIYFPLLGAIASFVIGKEHKQYSGVIATACAFLSFLGPLGALAHLRQTGEFEQTTYDWIKVDELSVGFTLRFDALTAVMCMVVTGVGSLIHLYSIGYMAEDEGQHKFFAYLNLFLF